MRCDEFRIYPHETVNGLESSPTGYTFSVYAGIQRCIPFNALKEQRRLVERRFNISYISLKMMNTLNVHTKWKYYF